MKCANKRIQDHQLDVNCFRGEAHKYGNICFTIADILFTLSYHDGTGVVYIVSQCENGFDTVTRLTGKELIIASDWIGLALKHAM